MNIHGNGRLANRKYRDGAKNIRCAKRLGVSYYRMSGKVLPARHPGAVKQFSVFTANRLGRLNDLISMLNAHQVHVVALQVLDTPDSTVIRLATDGTERAREVLHKQEYACT